MRIAAAAAALLLLAACTSSGAPASPPSGSRPTSRPAAPSSATALPSGASSAPDGRGTKIGIILPNRGPRWRLGELAALRAACVATRLNCTIQNARGDPALMATIADQMQAAGVRVLVLVPIDNSAGAIERSARAAGVLTVEYDQHVPHGSAAAFVRPDTTSTGRLLGQGLTRCPEVAGGPVPYVRIDAPNRRVGAAAQQAAYRRVLRNTPGWSLTAAATAGDTPSARAAAAPILRNFGGVRAVLATSDSVAAGVIAALDKEHHGPPVAVSGNGATIAGLQHVLAGTQCFTIYHPPAAGAQALTAALVRLANFERITSKHTVAAAGHRRTPVVAYGGARIVTADGVRDVIDDGFADRTAVCTPEYAHACATLGI
jgi:D-xylose transport system substrate-binding protein